MSKRNIVKTGIPGLDDIISGGLPRRRCILVEGGPGSGKTTFSIQFLYAGSTRFDEPGIFVTLTESPEEIRQNMLTFGWDLVELEERRKLTMIDARPVTLTKEGYISPTEALFKGEAIPFSQIARLLRNTIEETGAKRAVIDSVTVLTAQYEKAFHIRQGMLGLTQALSQTDCTTLFLSEVVDGQRPEPLMPLAYIVPGVIVLYYNRKGGIMIRGIQVLKMRGAKHSVEIHHMAITDSGIVVHPEERCEIS